MTDQMVLTASSHHASAGQILGSLDNVLGEIVEGPPYRLTSISVEGPGAEERAEVEAPAELVIVDGRHRVAQAPDELLSALAEAPWDQVVEYELRTARQPPRRYASGDRAAARGRIRPSG